MCQNGGALSESTCTCDCADGYSGDTCVMCVIYIDSHCLLLLIGYDLVLNHISMRLQFILHLAKRLHIVFIVYSRSG